MKTLGKTFAYIFMALALVSFVAGLCSAPHQFALTGICAVMAWVMYPQNNRNQSKINNHENNNRINPRHTH